MTAKLLFLDRNIQGESFTLKPEGTSLGRETDNDVVLQDGEISRHHARIVEKDGEWKVLFGCGGCGCLLTLLLVPAGVVMMLMANDSHLSELGPFGFIVTPLGLFIGFVSLVLLIIAFVKNAKK